MVYVIVNLTRCSYSHFCLHFIVSPEGSVAVSQEIIIASLGDSVTLSCSALGGPNITFQWIKDGIIIGNDSMLELVAIDASRGGDYFCIVSNAAGTERATSAVYVRPYIVTPLDSRVLTKVNGSALSITCDADGFPTPSVMWFNRGNVQVSNTSQLVLDPLSFGDEGLYTCVASNEINQTYSSAVDDTTIISKTI